MTLEDSTRVWRIKNWQRGLPIFPVQQLLSPEELEDSGIDTGILPGVHWNGLPLESSSRSENSIFNSINMLIKN